MPRYYRKFSKKPRYKKVGRHSYIGRTKYAMPQSFSGGFNAAMNVAKQALSIARGVKSLINVEYKYVDTDIADDTAIGYLPTSSIGQLLNGVAQGDGANERNGNSIKAKSLALSFDVFKNTAATTPQSVRWFILYTKDSDGAGPDLARIFTDATFETTRNRGYPYDSIVLAQGRVQVDAVRHDMVHIKKYIRLGFHEKFTGATNAYTDISRGDLHFVIWSDQSGNQPKLRHFQSRFTYIDN